MPEVKEAGVKLVVVGNGTPEQGKFFLEKTGLEADLYCDRDLDAYKAASMKRSVLRTLNPLSGFHMIRTWAKGFKPADVQGDLYQQGGVLVLTRAGDVAYHWASSVAGEAMPLDAILAAAKRAAPAAPAA